MLLREADGCPFRTPKWRTSEITHLEDPAPILLCLRDQVKAGLLLHHRLDARERDNLIGLIAAMYIDISASACRTTTLPLGWLPHILRSSKDGLRKGTVETDHNEKRNHE